MFPGISIQNIFEYSSHQYLLSERQQPNFKTWSRLTQSSSPYSALQEIIDHTNKKGSGYSNILDLFPANQYLPYIITRNTSALVIVNISKREVYRVLELPAEEVSILSSNKIGLISNQLEAD